MKLFDILAESRIREWQSRPEAERKKRSQGHEERVSYEAEVVREIDELLDRSRGASEDEKQRLLGQADERTTELLLLERRGYNLTARLVGDRIAEKRQGTVAKSG